MALFALIVTFPVLIRLLYLFSIVCYTEASVNALDLSCQQTFLAEWLHFVQQIKVWRFKAMCGIKLALKNTKCHARYIISQGFSSMFWCSQVCGGNVLVRPRSSGRSPSEEMRQILRRRSSQDQVLLQQGELLKATPHREICPVQ